MHGQCLCGAVRFQLSGPTPRLYQCHCSLCRKQGGGAANAAFLLPATHFQWLQGQVLIRSWQKDSGFRSDFCSQCGSPVPNPFNQACFYWVPAGLLDEPLNTRIAIHLCLQDKARWEPDPQQGELWQGLPPLDHLLAQLQPPAQTTEAASIRPARAEDTERLLNIWLSASLLAHDFIPARFWIEQLDAMRHQYLPMAQIQVHEQNGVVQGFIALVEQQIAALFVDPAQQGRGIGQTLLADARQNQRQLQLTVYQANPRSVRFYQQQGFQILQEQPDPHTGQIELLMAWSAT